MVSRNGSESSKRYHIVLVPGFGGFDALGKVEYYAGVTRVFKQWRAGKPAVLHYFDNLPTAAVVTRATRLQSYLAKRMARGEILEHDDIILVGHSTGGLDIRQLISNLHDSRNGEVHVDGGITVKRDDIRKRVRRVVFLSVPHWGTNIADWVHSNSCLRKTVVTELRAAVAGSQVALLDQIEVGITGGAAYLTGADLLRAVQDALTEANECYGEPSPQRTADAHEAASDLTLYFRDMASDFHVIEDLTSQPHSGPKSPAHFNPEQRKKEFKRWNDPHIDTLSYATVGNSPFRFVTGRPAPVWDLANPCTYPEVSKDPRLSKDTDVFYRLCYRACAGGPFERHAEGGEVTRRMNGAPQGPLELWDNDGIVNTLSMLWPNSENVLVACDHLDIVGHYKRVEVKKGEAVEIGRGLGREYQSYDALKSTPRFSDKLFKQVWTEIFDFSVGKDGQNLPGGRKRVKQRVSVEHS